MGKSSDTRPCRKRYTAEQRWAKNKLRKIKKLYKKHFNYSKNRKGRDLKLSKKVNSHKKYFFEKYPNVDSFLSIHKFKKPKPKREELVRTSNIPERFRK